MAKESGDALESTRRHRSSRSGRKRRRNTGSRRVLWLVICTMAAVGLLGDAVAAQTQPNEAAPVPVAISAEDPETAPGCAGSAAVEGSTTAEELIGDCEALLAGRQTLDPDGRLLNWSTDVAIRYWTGVRLARSARSRGQDRPRVPGTGRLDTARTRRPHGADLRETQLQQPHGVRYQPGWATSPRCSSCS